MRVTKLFAVAMGLTLSVGIGLNVATAAAVTASDWQAGRIMDDSVFFNASSMSAAQIQTFLNAKVPTCDTNGTQPYQGTTAAAYGTSHGFPPPYTCLKDYQADTPIDNSITIGCSSIPAAHRTAAQMIYDVANSCGINPQVLIVMLEVQQKLVTDTWPWSNQYQYAMGYGCPDNSVCNVQYGGLFNQLYGAAQILKSYTTTLTVGGFEANSDASIRYSPNSACGSSTVHIQNKATAALYSYTPYQPNAAALNNLTGAGDSCSSYTNRNFWKLFNDWFGSTLTPVLVPSANLTVNGAKAITVDYGTMVSVKYISTNVFDCVLQPGGTHGTASQFSTAPLTRTTTYTMSCSGPNGPATSSAAVTVRPVTFAYLEKYLTNLQSVFRSKPGLVTQLGVIYQEVNLADTFHRMHQNGFAATYLDKANADLQNLNRQNNLPVDTSDFGSAVSDLKQTF